MIMSSGDCVSADAATNSFKKTKNIWISIFSKSFSNLEYI